MTQVLFESIFPHNDLLCNGININLKLKHLLPFYDYQRVKKNAAKEIRDE